jgi:hypothetical protein
MTFWYFVEGICERHESTFFPVPQALEYEGTLFPSKRRERDTQ